MQQDHFLRNIEIIDFKCFKNFKAKDFKRVNLISGKNNVGKTAFMEGMYINLNSDSIDEVSVAITAATVMRNNLEYVYNRNLDFIKEFENIKFLNINSNIYKSKFELLNKDGIKEYSFLIHGKETIINANQFSISNSLNERINFIDNFGLSNSELKEIFEEIQKQDKEPILYKYINEFDNSILNFKVLGGNKPACKTIFSDEYQDINEFGDGLKHLISIICSLYASKDRQLFIDEIDNGIHYSQLERLWEIIFTISKEVNCQVFATTHSKEMINAFAKASKKLNDKDISFIELGRNKNNEIKANIYDKEMLEYELNQNHEVRGW